MTDEEFDRLLQHPDLPWAHLLGSEGERVVAAQALLAFVHEQGLSAEGHELDHHVRRRGGRKETEVWDLGDVPRNMVRTIMRRPPKLSRDAYVIP